MWFTYDSPKVSSSRPGHRAGNTVSSRFRGFVPTVSLGTPYLSYFTNTKANRYQLSRVGDRRNCYTYEKPAKANANALEIGKDDG
jgi:hypothetical protein